MSVEIYYFSGTGNSLAAASAIAEKVNGTLISIASVMDKPGIKTDADNIGIVFPSYLAQLHGVPLLVEQFIRKLENIEAKYIFAVCTCGGFENFNALPTLKNLGKLIKAMGGKLAAEFSIKLPMNNLSYYFFQGQDQEVMFKNCKKKIAVICQCITNRKKNKYKNTKALLNRLMTPLYFLLRNFYITELRNQSKEPKGTKLKYHEMIPLTDKSIYVDDKCNGCGTCAKVCPARNIKMVENKPVWQHHCEMCLACDEWCPVKAVHHWNKAAGKDYHHPGVKLADMLRQNTKAGC